jgi:hypothetical protein
MRWSLGQFRVSNVITSRVTGKSIVAGILPLFDKAGAFESALGVGIKLDWIAQIATEANTKFGGVLIVLDGKGRVISYQQDGVSPSDLAKMEEQPEIKAISSFGSSAFEAVDSTGTNRLFSVARVPDSGITVAVGSIAMRCLDRLSRASAWTCFSCCW